ncbi:MAG: hypothetical protein R3E95_07930 [Thiolinea sp.]
MLSQRWFLALMMVSNLYFLSLHAADYSRQHFRLWLDDLPIPSYTRLCSRWV